MDTNDSPKVTILVPIYNAENTLSEALSAIFQQSIPAFEVLAINDGSTDSSPEIVQSFQKNHPELKLLHKANGGEASALNLGWTNAKGDFVAILEADVMAKPNWLEVTLEVLQSDPNIIATGGSLSLPDNSPWPARLAGYEVEAKLPTKAQEVVHLTSANVLYRHEAFALAGPFDEHLINASLDAVFNARLSSKELKLVFNPKAKVRHHYKASIFGYLSRQYAYARYRVYNKRLDLYPQDRYLAVQVLATNFALLIGFSSLCAHSISPLPTNLLRASFLIPIFIFASLIPRALRTAYQRRDWAPLLSPFILFPRNFLAAVGYLLGLLEISLEPKK